MTLRRTEDKSKKATDPFEMGDAWRHFLSLERSLSDFIDNVPLDKRNQNVFSPKLGTILISAATQIEATFKAIVNSRYLDDDEKIDRKKLDATRKAIEKGRSNIINYRDILEPFFLLSRRRVTIRQTPKVYMHVYPFKKFRQGKVPTWWTSYTDLKHSFYDNIKEATLRRVVTGVSALFLIQMMHLTHRRTLIDLDVIRSGDKEYKGTGMAKSILINELCSSPREITLSIPVSNIWAETEFFEFDFMSIGK